MLIYSSFLRHTILECLPAVIVYTYHICVDKQGIGLTSYEQREGNVENLMLSGFDGALT